MRDEILKRIYDVYLDNLSYETDSKYQAVADYVDSVADNKHKTDDIDSVLVPFMYAVFMDSANIVLDFISDKITASLFEE